MVSGTNIKTINGNSLLGSGDLTLGGMYAYTVNVSPAIDGITWTNSCAVNDTIIIASEVQGQPSVYISNQTTTGCDVDDVYGTGVLNLISNADLGTVSTVAGVSDSYLRNELTTLTASDLEGVTKVGDYAFAYNTNLTSIALPSTVTKIGQFGFYYCSGITSLTLPNAVTEIGSSAFRYCTGLTSMTIPANVVKIGSSVFNNCTNLTTVTLEPTTPPVAESSSIFPSSVTTIYVPSASLNTYKTTQYWSSYSSKMIGV